MTDVVIASAARTAIGSFGRSLREVAPTELGATVARAAVERAGIEPDQVEQVVFGNVIHTAPEDMYMARVVGIRAGVPKESPAFTVNRLCGSGVQAIVSAAQAIQTGDAEIVLAGGAESMSRGAYWVQNARWGARMGDASLVDAVVGCLTDPFHEIHMGVTAENVAESHGISRDAQDEFALESHRRAQVAIEAGLFDEEVVPIEVKARKGTVEFRVDEHLRRDATLETVACAARSVRVCPAGEHGERSSNARSQFPQRDQRLERHPPTSRFRRYAAKAPQHQARQLAVHQRSDPMVISPHTCHLLSATERATASGLVLVRRAVSRTARRRRSRRPQGVLNREGSIASPHLDRQH
jgi:hypothetical protein